MTRTFTLIVKSSSAITYYARF